MAASRRAREFESQMPMATIVSATNAAGKMSIDLSRMGPLPEAMLAQSRTAPAGHFGLCDQTYQGFVILGTRAFPTYIEA